MPARLLHSVREKSDWRKFEWRFYPAAQEFGSLLGRLIHRELRSFDRSPSFYFYFDQYKALQAWNYWNHVDIALPFNGVIPKGEIGINPSYHGADFRFYRGKRTSDGLIVKHKYLNELKAEPKLVDLKYTFMRNK